MSKVFGSSGRRSNPMGFLSILTGVAGAGASAVLWIYRIEPDSQLLGQYSAQLARGGQLSEQLAALAAVLGSMASIASILTSTSGEGGAYFVGLSSASPLCRTPSSSGSTSSRGPVRPGFLS